MTTGVRMLKSEGITFTPHFYDYAEHGGTHRASMELRVDEHAVVKTLLFQSDDHRTFIVLMHGDREVSTKQLARVLGVRSVAPCDVATAQRLTGYTVGGISPFGTRTSMPIIAERTIFDLDEVFINGGKRGFLVKLAPAEIERVLHPMKVEVGIHPG